MMRRKALQLNEKSFTIITLKVCSYKLISIAHIKLILLHNAKKIYEWMAIVYIFLLLLFSITYVVAKAQRRKFDAGLTSQ